MKEREWKWGPRRWKTALTKEGRLKVLVWSGQCGCVFACFRKTGPPEERQRQRQKEIGAVDRAEGTRRETERREGTKRAWSDCGIK